MRDIPLGQTERIGRGLIGSGEDDRCRVGSDRDRRGTGNQQARVSDFGLLQGEAKHDRAVTVAWTGEFKADRSGRLIAYMSCGAHTKTPTTQADRSGMGIRQGGAICCSYVTVFGSHYDQQHYGIYGSSALQCAGYL